MTAKSSSKEMAKPGFYLSTWQAPEPVLLSSVLPLPPSFSDPSVDPPRTDSSGDGLVT